MEQRKNQFILIFGNVTTRIGSVAYSIALSMWLLDISSSAKILGNVKTISYIPMILLNLFSGYIADTFNKKKILIITDLISAMACIIFYFLGQEYYSNVIMIVIVNTIITVNSTIFSPSLRSLLPEVVGKDKIKQTNAILTNLSEVSKIVMPSIVVFLFSKNILNFSSMLFINGLTFLISAISEMCISYNYIKKESKQTQIENLVKGFNYLFTNKELMCIIPYTLFLNIALVIFDLLIPYYFKVTINKQFLLGFAVSLQSIGAVISSSIIILLKNNKYINLKNSIIALSLSFVFLIIPSYIAVYFASFLIGFFTIIFNVLLFSNIQERTQKEYLGRVISLIYFFSGIGLPIGSFAFSNLFSLKYDFAIYILCGYVFVILSIFIFAYKKFVQDVYN